MSQRLDEIKRLVGFESRIRSLFEAGRLPFLLHLAGGNEGQLIDIFSEVRPGDWIFSGHRSHYHYLLAGGKEAVLEAKICRGDSMFVFDQGLNFLTSSVLAGTCAIAAGVAARIKAEGGHEKVWCFLGDGGEDEGHFYEAARYVEGRQLPCIFVIEDNNRSCGVSKEQRHGKVVGLDFSCIRRYTYLPVYPHAGTGCRQMVVFNSDLVQEAATRQRS